jgi:hypothetical protein
MNVLAGTEKNHEKSQDKCCIGLNTNWVFPECMSEAFSVDSAARPNSGEC